MSNYPIDSDDRQGFILSLIAGEILTRRGDPGPLARIFSPRPRSRTTPPLRTTPKKEPKADGK